MATGSQAGTLRRSGRRQESLESTTEVPENNLNELATGLPPEAEPLETETLAGNIAGAVEEAPNNSDVVAVAAQLQSATLNSVPDTGLPLEPSGTPQGVSNSNVLTREDFLEAMQNMMASLGSAVGTASQVRSTPHDLRLSDVKLSEFSGNDDTEANAIHPDYFLSLLGWIRECRTVLSFSGLNAKEQIVVLVNNLRGAARRAFFHAYKPDSFASWSVPDITGKLVALIPDHAVLFSNKAISMSFSASNLREDIDVFADLVHFGEIPATGRFWFDQLQTKLLEAQSNFLTLASDLLNLRLEYRPSETFAQTICRAIEVGTRLQTAGKLVQVFKGSKPQKVFNNSHRKRKSETRTDSNNQVSVKKSKVQRVAKPDLGEAKKLALEFDRCPACGFFVAPTDKSKHHSSCKNDPQLLLKRMWRVKTLKAEGKSKAEINNFSKNLK